MLACCPPRWITLQLVTKTRPSQGNGNIGVSINKLVLRIWHWNRIGKVFLSLCFAQEHIAPHRHEKKGGMTAPPGPPSELRMRSRLTERLTTTRWARRMLLENYSFTRFSVHKQNKMCFFFPLSFSRKNISSANVTEKRCQLRNFIIFNSQFGFRKWKGNVTEKPIEDRSDIDKELHTDLSIVKQQEGLFYYLICTHKYCPCIKK